MTTDAWKSLIIKILLMILTPLAAQLHLDMGVVSLPAIAADLADLAVLAYGLYRSNGMKLVPHDSTAVQNFDGGALAAKVGDHVQATGKVVGALLIGFLLIAQLPTAHAATVGATASPAPGTTTGNGVCSLQTFVATFKTASPDPLTFLPVLTRALKLCGASDTSAALNDAKEQDDNEAVACLKPLNALALAAQSSDGNSLLFFRIQKFRTARRSGIVTACLNYFNSTFGAFK